MTMTMTMTMKGQRKATAAMGAYLLLAATIMALLTSSIVLESEAFSSSVPTCQRPFSVGVSDSNSNHHIHSALFASDEASTNENDKDENENDDESPKAKEENENEPKGEQEAAAERWQQQARDLREQIQKMEADLPERIVDPERVAALKAAQEAATAAASSNKEGFASRNGNNNNKPVSLLDGKNILLVGANGRLGSMVCRRLLRQYPEIANVVAMVHVVGENSETSRGYGRLAYEVGAEDGRGSIGPAWSAEERTATFEFDEEIMTPYNLQKLRIVECELLDPVQCKTIVDDAQADIVVWCATDFNGSTPRAISGGSGPLSSLPFLFRAVSDPDKGRVEVEGLQNMLGALKTFKQESIQRRRQLSAFGGSRIGGYDDDDNDERSRAASQIPDAEKEKDDDTRGVDFLLVSTCPDALSDFETPFGAFRDIKRQGEEMIPDQFPSLKYSVLQFATYEDNFVKEDLDFKCMEVVNEAPRIPRENQSSSQKEEEEPQKKQTKVRRINRRDAARAVGEALVDPDYHNKKIQVWTNEVGK